MDKPEEFITPEKKSFEQIAILVLGRIQDFSVTEEFKESKSLLDMSRSKVHEICEGLKNSSDIFEEETRAIPFESFASATETRFIIKSGRLKGVGYAQEGNEFKLILPFEANNQPYELGIHANKKYKDYSDKSQSNLKIEIYGPNSSQDSQKLRLTLIETKTYEKYFRSLRRLFNLHKKAYTAQAVLITKNPPKEIENSEKYLNHQVGYTLSFAYPHQSFKKIQDIMEKILAS